MQRNVWIALCCAMCGGCSMVGSAARTLVNEPLDYWDAAEAHRAESRNHRLAAEAEAEWQALHPQVRWSEDYALGFGRDSSISSMPAGPGNLRRCRRGATGGTSMEPLLASRPSRIGSKVFDTAQRWLPRRDIDCRPSFRPPTSENRAPPPQPYPADVLPFPEIPRHSRSPRVPGSRFRRGTCWLRTPPRRRVALPGKERTMGPVDEQAWTPRAGLSPPPPSVPSEYPSGGNPAWVRGSVPPPAELPVPRPPSAFPPRRVPPLD